MRNRTHLKKVFWPKLGVGRSYQILEIPAVFTTHGIGFAGTSGLIFAAALILNQNPFFEIDSKRELSVWPLRHVTIMLTLLIVSRSLACSQISLSEYQARNRAEEEIKTVLLEYLDALQRFDRERFLACLPDWGKFHFE